MSGSNPYRANQVNLDLFHGRDFLVEELISGLLSGQSFALMGGRRMGKTTLLRAIESRVDSRLRGLKAGGSKVIPVYVDVRSLEELSTPDTISQTIVEATRRSIDRQLDGKPAHIREHQLSNALAQDLLDCVVSVRNYRTQIIVLFDEISPIVNADWGTAYLGNWRSLLSNSPPLSNHVSAVFAGGRDIVSLADDVCSPLAGILSWQTLQPFSARDTRLLVEEAVHISLPDGFHDRVFELTGGHPFLIQYLMHRVVQSSSSDVYQALEQACAYFLENEFRQFESWFSDFDVVAQEIYEGILSQEEVKKSDLAKAFKGSGLQTQVHNYLKVLSSYGVVRQTSGQTYAWCGELFRSWYVDNQPKELRFAPTLESSVTVERPMGELIRRNESASLEFKSTLQWDLREEKLNTHLRDSVLKTITAFLNSGGGTLIIGVDDNGHVLGLKHDIKTTGNSRDEFEQLLTSLISDRIGVELSHLIRMRFETVDDEMVCAVDIEPAEKPAFLRKNRGREFFIRVGNTTRRLDVEETVRYVKANWH